ncbi:MAG: tetratricopeptide repeat protein, partial [Chryseobacterium sp.]|nr:tetratricopeptide repeat protein [Chryseobacterium sp.]
KNTMYCLIELSKALIDNNQITEAKDKLNESISYARSKSYYMKFEKDIEELNLKIAVKEKNVPKELLSRRRLDQLDDSLAYLDSQKNLDRNNILAQKERYSSKLSLANAQYEKEQLKTNAFIVIAILLLILIILIIFINKRQQHSRKTRYERKVLQLQLEKLTSEQKLSDAHFTLDSMNVYLTEKNLQIEHLNKEINRVQKQSSYSILEKEEQKLQTLLDSHLMTDENWQKFKKAFQNEQSFFYKQLILDFPDLTESNLRIILLSKLGLSNPDISSLLGVTLDAIKKAKQRLRKKIGSDYDSILSEI